MNFFARGGKTSIASFAPQIFFWNESISPGFQAQPENKFSKAESPALSYCQVKTSRSRASILIDQSLDNYNSPVGKFFCEGQN
ncbi:hypothetical protein DP117_13435 [Brasilonema sp. UFV-L1]|nr:hypothetical protein [Brasilonema sp. UFV-L1]